MAKNTAPPSVPQQEFDWRRTSNVTEAMQQAGAAGRSRIAAGVKAYLRGKTDPLYGGNTSATARLMRMFGMQTTAKWYDRFFGLPAPKRKAGGREEGQGEQRISRTIKTQQGMMRIFSTRLNAIHGITLDTQQSVEQIKSMLMPKVVTAVGKKGSKQEGQEQNVMYNPLAPAGEQFREVTPTGAISARRPSKGFQDSATQKAAMETAKLALKMQQKTEAKAELKKKYGYKDTEEKYKEENPLEKIEERLKRIEEKLDGKDKKSNWLLSLLSLLGSWFTKKFPWLFGPTSIIRNIMKSLTNLTRLVKKVVWKTFNAVKSSAARLLPRLAGTAGSAMGAAAITAAQAKMFDMAIKQQADRNIDKVLTDVTNDIRKGGQEPSLSSEAHYLRYKLAMQRSLGAGASTDPAKAAYHQQQWLGSEGLSDLERGMAQRFFVEQHIADQKIQEKNAGPRKRGGKRRKAEVKPVAAAVEAVEPAEEQSTEPPILEELTVAAPRKRDFFGFLRRKRKPSSTTDLLNQIAKGEGTSDDLARQKGFESGYDVTLGYGRYHKPTKKPLSKMTLAEVRNLQNEMLKHPENNHNSSAVGRYQIVRTTLFGKVGEGYPNAGLKAALNLKDSDIFSPELQDKLAHKLLEQRGLKKFQAGVEGWDAEKFQKNLSLEWASIADPTTGTSAYQQATGTTTSDIQPLLTALGPRLDADTRALQAIGSAPAAPTTIAPTTVVNNNVTSSTPLRPAQRADTISKDDAFVRSALRDTFHPMSL